MALLKRLRTTRMDVLEAVAFTAAGLVQVTLSPIGQPGFGEAHVLGATLPLAWRRSFPVESALVSASFWLIPLSGFPVLGFVVVILQFFALGLHGESRRAVAAATAAAATIAVISTLLGPEAPVAVASAVLVVVAPTLAGRLVRHLRHNNNALEELTRELTRERERSAEAAVGAERARIAHELHDVVGHEVTLIAIHAEAAAAALQSDPVRAAQPIETIRATAHEVLTEMRGVLDMLAPLADGDRIGLEDLDDLVGKARQAGLEVTLTQMGSPAPGHSPAGMAVFRIVRECLTNAARHAPGQPIAIDVEWGSTEVVVRASNTLAPGVDSPIVLGRGLTGIKHRANLLGGTFNTASQDGRFDVLVVIPVRLSSQRGESR